jgi:mannan endo-1,4-beta-mannosidase
MKTRMARRHFIKTTSLALPVALNGFASVRAGFASAGPKDSDFVSIRDGRFQLRKRPYIFIGTNLWYACYLGDPKLEGGRQRLIRELDRLKAIGVTNVRILAGSESSKLAGAIPRGITRAPHDWDENLLTGLDFALSEMARRDMRAVLSLSNYWQWSGGFAQYVSSVTGEPIPDPERPEAGGTWGGFMKFSARFYSNPQATELYREYLTLLAARRNTCNGRVYSGDPSIMTWELANEPRPGTDENASMQNLPAFYSWLDATARLLHSVAPNHLVTTGTEGIAGCLKKREVFLKAHESPAIDYVNMHLWPKNWGWLRDPQLSAQYESAVAKGLDYVEKHVAMATDILRKPITLEEFGLPRDHENLSPESTTSARDDFYGRMFELVEASCKAGRALQGANFWTWGGEGRASAGKRESAEALTGDPFCEPQGLNSVFDTDKRTLAIIAKYNQRLMPLTT